MSKRYNGEVPWAIVKELSDKKKKKLNAEVDVPERYRTGAPDVDAMMQKALSFRGIKPKVTEVNAVPHAGSCSSLDR